MKTTLPIRIMLSKRPLSTTLFAALLTIGIWFLPNCSNAEIASPDCVEMSDDEIESLLNVSIYTDGAFSLKPCRNNEHFGILYIAKSDLRSVVFENNDFPISSFEPITNLSGCEAITAAYHIWAYFLFNKANSVYSKQLERFNQYLSNEGVACANSFSGFVSLKILHALLNRERYSDDELALLTGDRAAEIWRDMIENGDEEAIINIAILQYVLNNREHKIEGDALNKSTNLLLLKFIGSLCENEEPLEKNSFLSLPLLTHIEEFRNNNSEAFAGYCSEGSAQRQFFQYQSEW